MSVGPTGITLRRFEVEPPWIVVAFPCRNCRFPDPNGSASMPKLIWIATRGVMEILGLVPFQSETQYLEQKFRVIAE